MNDQQDNGTADDSQGGATSKPHDTRKEEAFFERGDSWDGRPVPDDYVDPEFADIESAPGLLQPILILLVLGFASFLAWQYRGELVYALSSDEPIALGDTSDDIGGDAFDGQPLPSNRYVSLQGIGVQRAVSGSREYQRLLGTHIYVQLEEPTGGDEQITFGEASQARGARKVIGGEGRLVPAAMLPRQLKAVFDYYSRQYGVRFCSLETPPEIVRYRESEKEAAILAFRDEHGRDPTQEELRERIGPECVDGHLFQLNRSPDDFRIYFGLYGAFAIVVIVSIMLLVRWVRRIRQSRPGNS
jgi:hypothetical protein